MIIVKINDKSYYQCLFQNIKEVYLWVDMIPLKPGEKQPQKRDIENMGLLTKFLLRNITSSN